MKLMTLLFMTLLWVTQAQAKISVNGLFIGKAIIKIDGKPVMFFEGDKKQGVKLISANEDRAIVEIEGKQQTMYLDLSIANEYSKPVKVVPYGQTRANQILNVALVHQTNNIATFKVEYDFAGNADNYVLTAQTMVDKKAVNHASYNYVPLKAGKQLTYITLGIEKAAPATYQSDHVLINFAHKKTNKAFSADSAKIIAFKKTWQH